MTENHFELFRKLLKDDGADDFFIASFEHYYTELLKDQTGYIPENSITAVTKLDDAENPEHLTPRMRDRGAEALRSRTVMIKLNGGLGTTMGCDGPKSLLPVRTDEKGEPWSFLQIIVAQADRDGVPLLLMNSRMTESATLEALPPDLQSISGLSNPSFLQHRQPRIRVDNKEPVKCPDPDDEWCPPGHGDLFLSLVTTGTLAKLQAAGYRYAFVSNADNLGAVADAGILGYLIEHECPFLMEAADRLKMDSKGGHLAWQDNKLTLRESAQRADDEAARAAFEDYTVHRYFNTNSLWLDLEKIGDFMQSCGDRLDLPMIRNKKTVKAGTGKGKETDVYQLETAMGSAISVIPGARAIRVPRVRFAPVKGTNELLLVRSDAYAMDGCRIYPTGDTTQPTTVDLDEKYFKTVEQLEARFAAPPSMRECTNFKVRGDWTFGRDVVLRGDVELKPPGEHVPDGAVFDRR